MMIHYHFTPSDRHFSYGLFMLLFAIILMGWFSYRQHQDNVWESASDKPYSFQYGDYDKNYVFPYIAWGE